MRYTILGLIAAMGLSLGVAGCQTEPKTEEKRESLSANADAALKEMKSIDPEIEEFINRGHGHVIFPSVGKGGLIVGGAYGRGLVFEQGQQIGFADLTQANIGLQAGGQTYKEVIVFENADALNRFKSGKLRFSADASAVAIKAGASKSAAFKDGVAVFTHPNGGLMFEASVGGQNFSFIPNDAVSNGDAETSSAEIKADTDVDADVDTDGEVDVDVDADVDTDR